MIVNPAHFQTYRVLTPRSTHYRRASCAEVECGPHRNGFEVLVDEATPLGREQAAYLRSDESGRVFTEDRRGDALTAFMFHPGQPCFVAHEVPLERDPIFLVRRGTARVAAGEPRVMRRPEDWIDHMQTHLDRLRG